MLLIGFAAAVLAVLSPQTEPDFEALLAPARTPNEVAAFCFAPANRRPGERDRDCQYRVLAEEARRIDRIDGLRRRCAGQAVGSTDACVVQILTAEHAAAEAAKAERAERARRGDDLFGDLFSAADPMPAPPARPSAPTPRPAPTAAARRSPMRTEPAARRSGSAAMTTRSAIRSATGCCRAPDACDERLC